jgi:hypothetical protein
MSDKSLVQLSEESKALFASGKHHDASKLFTEAVERFPQAKGDRIDQGPDGTLCITTVHTDENGSQKIVKQVPVDRSSAEYRAEDYRDTSKDDVALTEEEKVKASEASNNYGKVNVEGSVTEGPRVSLSESDEASDEDDSSFTKAELQEKLDEAEIEYDSSSNKAELLALYREHKSFGMK